MILKLDAKRRLTLPKDLLPVESGDSFEVTFDAGEDLVICRRIAKPKDWLSVMKECPVSMEDLPARSREYFKSKL